jgi:pimeloyl-ACP methyl ester carboxylesterase
VAFSDYGPASGDPVLLLHSSMTTRIVSRKLLRALHQAGFRPIAIDRPGFGLTDPIPGEEAASDPFHAASADVRLVLAHLKVRRVHVASRGAAQFVVALGRAMPEALGQVVIVNPGPPYRHGGRSIGPLASLKDAFLRNPANIRLAAPLLARRLTYRRLSQMMVQWTRGSPPDEAAVRDPELVADFFRSVRMFATGRYQGFLTEQTAIARTSRPAPFDGAAGWRLLLGASDVLYEPAVVIDYWRKMLPGAEFTLVEDGGRFLAMTHPELVVAALRGEAGAP